MSLRQNESLVMIQSTKFSYQSECHCAKTAHISGTYRRAFSYQSECHCAKTCPIEAEMVPLFSYQSECHCAKTG